MRGGPLIEDARFHEETSHLEAGSTVAGSNEYVLTDRAGFRKLAMPRPEPGQADGYAAEYAAVDLEENAFTVARQTTILYQTVVAFRRDGDGEYEIREEAGVPNRGNRRIPKKRIKYLPDFVGDRREAVEAVQRKARELARGAFAFDLRIWANPDITQYATIRAEDIEIRGGVPWLVSYDCLVEEISPTHKLGEHHMALKGHATIGHERELGLDPFRRSHVTPGIYTPPPPAPAPIDDYGYLAGEFFFRKGLGYMGYEPNGGHWIEEGSATGIDENGWWVTGSGPT